MIIYDKIPKMFQKFVINFKVFFFVYGMLESTRSQAENPVTTLFS